MVRRLFSDVVRLVESWWKVDRIRVSPREGRLLRLQPSCVVVVDGRPAEVTARTLSRTAGDAEAIFITYECRSAHGMCELRIEVTMCGAIAGVFWSERKCERQIAEESVEVY